MAASNPNTSANRDKSNSYSYSKDPTPNTTPENGNAPFNYTEVYTKKEVNSSASFTKNSTNKPTSTGVWGINMGRVDNFTLDIPAITEANVNFKVNSRGGSKGRRFLPVKTLNFTPIGLKHKKISAGVISDLPFFYQRNLGKLDVTILDDSKSSLSAYLYSWYASCVDTKKGVVPYIDDLCKTCVYSEYDHAGKEVLQYKFYVIPENDISVGRKYDSESGELTEYKFTLLIISDISVTRPDYGGEWVEADWGNGEGPDAHYERRVSAAIVSGNTYYNYIDRSISDYTK